MYFILFTRPLIIMLLANVTQNSRLYSMMFFIIDDWQTIIISYLNVGSVRSHITQSYYLSIYEQGQG